MNQIAPDIPIGEFIGIIDTHMSQSVTVESFVHIISYLDPSEFGKMFSLSTISKRVMESSYAWRVIIKKMKWENKPPIRDIANCAFGYFWYRLSCNHYCTFCGDETQARDYIPVTDKLVCSKCKTAERCRVISAREAVAAFPVSLEQIQVLTHKRIGNQETYMYTAIKTLAKRINSHEFYQRHRVHYKGWRAARKQLINATFDNIECKVVKMMGEAENEGSLNPSSTATRRSRKSAREGGAESKKKKMKKMPRETAAEDNKEKKRDKDSSDDENTVDEYRSPSLDHWQKESTEVDYYFSTSCTSMTFTSEDSNQSHSSFQISSPSQYQADSTTYSGNFTSWYQYYYTQYQTTEGTTSEVDQAPPSLPSGEDEMLNESLQAPLPYHPSPSMSSELMIPPWVNPTLMGFPVNADLTTVTMQRDLLYYPYL